MSAKSKVRTPRYWTQPATVLANAAISALLTLCLAPVIIREASVDGGGQIPGLLLFAALAVVLFILASMASQAFIGWRASRRRS